MIINLPEKELYYFQLLNKADKLNDTLSLLCLSWEKMPYG